MGLLVLMMGMAMFSSFRETTKETRPETGDTVSFEIMNNYKGRAAKNLQVINKTVKLEDENKPVDNGEDNPMLDDDIEDLDTSSVDLRLLREIADWKREAKAEDSYRYFWHVREVDQISQGKEKVFCNWKKGSEKLQYLEHFNKNTPA
ncbi:MAG: hypothetical protein R3F36_02825 [Candidatus Competibacteraceae bacterium]